MLPSVVMTRTALGSIAALIVVVALAACASMGFPADATARPAAEVPERFDGADESPSAPACRTLLVDPRDGAELVLVRSLEGRGDYEPPVGRYGVGAHELLRIDCDTRRVIGIVDRLGD